LLPDFDRRLTSLDAERRTLLPEACLELGCLLRMAKIGNPIIAT
jgi:hypothetical protein